jgi:tRNA 2-selenouridine synthase
LNQFPSVTCAEFGDYDTIIDVRSPAEFALDHVPGAISAPVLDNQERIRIGTLHKQVSAFDAKKAGAALVARNIARHLEEIFQDRPRSWRPLVYCWRGGQRSGSMAEIFSRIGWKTAQLDGGYRAYRRHVLQRVEEIPAGLTFRIVCGVTGSGKSRLLRALDGSGAQVLDLEELARHRGSVLGSIPGEPQPSQKMFESLLWRALESFTPDRPVFVEAESKKVGAVQVPDALMVQMRASPCVRLELDLPLRVALLKEEYAHFLADGPSLEARFDCLIPLHGRERIGEWKRLSAEHAWDELVLRLLTEHYDPAYLRGMPRNYAGYAAASAVRITALGDAAFVSAASATVTAAG